MAWQFPIRRFASGSYLVFLTGVVVVAGFVWYVTRYQYRKVMLIWEARQTTVVADRGHIISEWLMERRADAEVASVARCTRELLSSGSGQMPLARTSRQPGGSPTLMLDTIRSAHGYLGIYVLDREGTLVARAAGSEEMPLRTAELGRSVVQSGQFRVDFLREDGERVLISFSTPVFDQRRGDLAGRASSSAVGLVALVSDANKDLFAFLTTEVVPTKTGETVLLVREGKEVLYFSPLRHAPSGLARLRPALNDPNFGAKAALEGREVFGEFTDYRGVRVLAALRRIPLTGWGLMSKIDREEALADYRRTAWMRVIAAGLFILALAGGVSSYRRHLSSMIMKEEDKRFRSLLESTPDGLVIMDRGGRIALVNWQAERLFGYERNDLVNGPFKTLVPEESYRRTGGGNAGPFFPAEVPHVTLAVEAEGRRKDGRRFPIEISFGPIASKEHTLVCAGIRDITERKRAEAELAERLRFESLLADLSARFVNVPAEQLDDEIEEALRRVCECLGVEASSLWQASAETRSVIRLTHVYRPLGGPPLPERIDAQEYFPWCLQQIVHSRAKAIAVSSLEELPAEAARDREAWRRLGVKSALVIGLSVGGETPVGALSFNTMGARRTWSEEVVNRLQLVAQMFSNALARQRSDRALRESAERYRTLFENAPLGIYRTTPDGRIVAGNPAFVRMMGYSSFEDLASRNLNAPDFEPEYSRSQFREKLEKEGRITGLESQWRRHDGSVIFIRENARVIRDDSGRLLYYEGTSEDVTERKRAEEALEQAAKRFKLVTLATQDAVFDWDLVSHEIWRNENYQRLFGAPERNLDSDNWWSDRLHLEDRERVVTAQNAALGGEGNLFSSEFRLRRPDGSYADIVERSLIVRDAEGQAVRMIGALTDISERKRAEEALRESEDRYRDLIEHSQDLICTHDLEGHILSVNEPPARSLGYERSKLLKMRVQDILVPEVRGEFGKYVAVLRRDGAAQGLMLVQTATGERRIWEYNNTLRTEGVPAPIVRGLAHDVTERTRAQKALRRSEQRYRELADSIADVFFATDKDLKYTYWNKASEDLTGISARDAIGKSLYQLFPHVGGTRWEKVYLEALETGRPRSLIDEFRIEGQLKTFEINVYPSRHGLSVFARDVTERRRAEEGLRRSEQFNREVIASAREGIIVYDREFRFQVWNRFMEELTGLPASQVLGKQGFDLFPHMREYKMDVLLQRALEGQVVHSPDMHFRVPLTGKSGWASSVLNPNFGPNGEIIGVISILHDITERKRAEDALRQSEERYRGLFEDSLEGIGLSKGNKVINANRALLDIFGYSDLEEFKALPLLEHVAPQSRGLIREIWEKQHREEPYPKRFEYQIIRKNGEVRRLEISTDRVSFGSETYTQSTFRDITERKRAEEALRESEARFRSLFENVAVGIYRTTPEGGILMANPTLVKMWGFNSFEALAALNLEAESRVNGYPRSAFREQIEREGEVRGFESTWQRRDGKVILIRESARLVRAADGGILYDGIVEDVTERKRAEDALRESEARFRSLFENATVGIYRTTPEGRILMGNPTLVRMLGFNSFQEMAARNLELEGFATGCPRSAFREQIERDGEVRGFESAWKRDDGTLIFVRESARAVRAGDGRILYYDGIVEDVTERKRAEEALAASEQRYRELFESANDVVFSYDLQGNITSANKAAERHGGYTHEELTSMNVVQLVPPENVEKVRRAVEAIAAGRDPGFTELEVVTKDGHRALLEVSSRVLRSNAEVPEVQVIARDVTERKRAEEELQRSFDRLRALAARLQRAREEERTSVAREIHDELGQALTAIKIDLSFVIRELPEDKKRRPESILKLVDRTIQSVRRIASELRPAILDALGLVAALEWAAEEFEVRTGIKCRLDLPQKDIVIEQESATALFRIFQETLTNVVRHAHATEVNVQLAREKGRLTLSIRDNGKGVDAEQLSSSRSLGILGMRERALLLGGELDIHGAPGKGTTVRVCIPEDHPTQSEGGR